MYTVQNDTGIKLNVELYIKVIFVGQGVGIQKAYPGRWNKTCMTSHTLLRRDWSVWYLRSAAHRCLCLLTRRRKCVDNHLVTNRAQGTRYTASRRPRPRTNNSAIDDQRQIILGRRRDRGWSVCVDRSQRASFTWSSRVERTTSMTVRED